MARTIRIPVTPSKSDTARCTRTFIWSRLFCIRRTQSPLSETRLVLSRTNVRTMQTSSFGRNEAANRPQLRSRRLPTHSRSDRSSCCAQELPRVAACLPPTTRSPLPPIPRAVPSSRLRCSPSLQTPHAASEAISPSGSTPASYLRIPPSHDLFHPLLEHTPNGECFPKLFRPRSVELPAVLRFCRCHLCCPASGPPFRTRPPRLANLWILA